MKKLILLLYVFAISSSSGLVQAQELLTPPNPASMELLPPNLEMDEGIVTGSESQTLEPIASGDWQDSGSTFSEDESFQLFGADIALLESSGTWLRRGFWFTEVDVMLLDRIWRRDNSALMSQQVGATSTPFGTVALTNDLLVEGGRYGAEAVPRMKLGRFLFRDAKNRDHTAEFTAFGGGQWSQGGRLDANPNNSANTTFLFTVPGRGNGAFDGATSSQYDYDSRMNSFELNYHVKTRMRRDRMELEPNGQWIRRAQPTNSHSFIAGIRYIDISENINWSAFGIPDSATDNDNDTETGTYRVRSGNDLFGTQLGFSWSHDRARWSLGLRGKGGIFINGSDVRSNFNLTGTTVSGNNNISNDNLSFLTEGAVFAKWHLRPNFSLRAGLEGLFLTSLALAPDQLNFAPTSTAELIADGHAIFLGGSIGFEGYW